MPRQDAIPQGSPRAPILEVKELKKYFRNESGLLDRILLRDVDKVRAVDGVDLELHEEEIVGIIGESGCGKSTLLESLIGLEPPTAGDIQWQDRSISEFSRNEWKQYRRDVQIIFQDPFNSLDPNLTIRESLLEPLKVHGISDKDERFEAVLREVQLHPPDRYIEKYPSQLSGGELQRIAIARALMLEPNVILADEPVSMLDVSIQAAVLNLLKDLADKRNLSMLYISHDISTVAYICDSICVMYLGQIVEQGETMEVIRNPKHPYTEALINAVPIPDPYHDREHFQIEGDAFSSNDRITGCRFKDRCPERMDICEEEPLMVESDSSEVACHLYYDHTEIPAEEASQAGE